jgi:hypothetical protein
MKGNYMRKSLAIIRWKRNFGQLLILFAASILSGCGTMVPEIRDFPNNTSYAQNNALVQAIVRSIHCELEDAVTNVINNDNTSTATFLKKWGAQVALTLQLEERTTLNPNTVWTPPSPATAIFSLAGGVTGSADATRIDKVNYYYKVSDLYLGKYGQCSRDQTAPTDSLLIQSDLKLAEWLNVMVNGVATGNIDAVSDKNVLSHEITFEIDTSGNVTPAWKLVHVTVDQSGSLLSASRNRGHDLIVTFGPLDKTNKGSFLIPIADSTHISSQTVSGINSAFRILVGQ